MSIKQYLKHELAKNMSSERVLNDRCKTVIDAIEQLDASYELEQAAFERGQQDERGSLIQEAFQSFIETLDESGLAKEVHLLMLARFKRILKERVEIRETKQHIEERL